MKMMEIDQNQHLEPSPGRRVTYGGFGTKRSITTPHRSKHTTLAARTVNWLFPWTRRSYCGPRQGMVDLLERRVGRTEIEHWKSGYRSVPTWALELLRDRIRERVSVG